MEVNRKYHRYQNPDNSQFMAFEPCPNCGSRITPALARYTDGHAWCFSCHYYEPASFFRVAFSDRADMITPNIVERGGTSKMKPIPEKASPFLSIEARFWLRKYEIREQEILRNDLKWDDDNKWLIFPYYGDANNLEAWQARCFRPGDPKKWLSFGQIHDILHIIRPNKLADEKYADTIILVEDIVSAIKVGRHFMCMPVFGSNVALKTLTRLATQFSRVGIWLDKDKEKEAFRAASRGSQYMDTFVISKILDPKDHTDGDIIKIITEEHADDYAKGQETC